jgi:DNA polymerase III subunit alpha
MGWAPLHLHTHYSLLDGIAKPGRIVKRCLDYGYEAVAMTDHGNIGAAVDFVNACKKKIKPILGEEFYLCRGDDPAVKDETNERPYNHLVVLAKNLAGWKQIIAATSFANKKEHFYYQPRLSRESFRDFAKDGNLIAFSGHIGSEMANAMFKDPKLAYRLKNYDEVKSHVAKDWRKRITKLAQSYQNIFGDGNFFLEIQILDPDEMPAALIVAGALRQLGSRLHIPCVATADSHYVDPADAEDQRVVLCANMQTTLRIVRNKLDTDQDVALGGFFSGDSFHIPSEEEMLVNHTREELDNALRIASMCEEYDILRQPMLPHFPCPDGMSPDTYLTELCERGWREKIEPKITEHQRDEYRQRLDMELGVFKGAGLSSYFLIVQDFINYGYSQGWLMGGIRGSGAGCLVSHLINISDIDPIPYGLLFERFYNAGRNTPGNISLPDIDTDVRKYKRDDLFHYLERRYGPDHVAKIATFNSMQGRSALTEVFRAHEVDFGEQKRITKIIPDRARISEELADIKEAFTDEEKAMGKEPSIIDYALDIFPKELSEWVTRREDGSLGGDYASHFEQAMRLEGMKRNISQHAAGVIITPEPVANLFPLHYDSGSDSYIAAQEYPALEAQGAPKFDILAVAFLDKAQGVQRLARYGRIEDDE